MTRKNNKLLKIILVGVITIFSIGFFVNWFLTYRLEKFLREELSKRVSHATNGLYVLDFDKLSIGLFNGELSVSNLVLKPESATFDRWSANDSLPETYLDISIGLIRFRGLNLTWRSDYKQLNFSLFEVTNPTIKIFESKDSIYIRQEEKANQTKTPYEMISEYINTLTVKEIRFENANVSYSTVSRGNPSTYSLKNANFHAYDFRLDKDSYYSGKLMYSDNFDFSTITPQTLVTNNQFILNIDAIRLSTRDSLVQVNNLGLIPQKSLWAQSNQTPNSYVEASVDSVFIKGVNFSRDNANNHLNANSFNIFGSDISYFETKRDSINRKPKDKKKSSRTKLNLSWSLYTITSPILKSILIDTISVEDAKLAYTSKSTDNEDRYKMESFNFRAYHFRVDSATTSHREFLYSKDFDVIANNIDAVIASKNYILNIGQMFLSTISKRFDVKDVKLWPISTHTNIDYVKGSIDSLNVFGIEYDKGISIKAVTLDSPVLEYVKMPSKIKYHNRREKTDTIFESTLPIDIISPYIKFLTIDKVNLNNGNITFSDKRASTDLMIYKIPKVDFYASNIRIDKQTLENSSSYISYDDFGFKFENFNNLLPGKEYKLYIKQGYYTGSGGNLRLSDIRLKSQKHPTKKNLALDVDIKTPLIELKKINFKKTNAVDVINLKLIKIDNPEINITRLATSVNKAKSQQKLDELKIDVNNFLLTSANLKYTDKVKGNKLNFTIDRLGLKSLVWDLSDKLWVDEILLQSPSLHKIEQNAPASTIPSDKQNEKNGVFLSKAIHLNKIRISDLRFNLDRPVLKFDSKIKTLEIDGVDNSDGMFNIGKIQLLKPIVDMNQITDSKRIVIDSTKQTHSSDLYAIMGVFSKHLSVGQFDIVDAEIQYKNTLDGMSGGKQQINSTNFNFTGLVVDTENRNFNMDDFNFNTKNLNIPLDNGFFNLGVKNIDIRKKDSTVKLDQIQLISAFPKEEFASRHPKHSDWFDVSVNSLTLSGIDYPTYFSRKILNINDVAIDGVKLLNFKNQNIDVIHRPMPLIYEGLQKAPIKMNVTNFDVTNFMVSYEELPKGSDKSGEIFFTDINGKFEGFTNIVSKPQQYIKLDADGKLMGTGGFTATWYIPVDSLNDRFLLTGNLNHFELTDLNPLITPMAPFEIRGGHVDNLLFKTEASSKGANVQMRFLYSDLNVAILKNASHGYTPNKFFSGLANAVIRRNNPSRQGRKPRESNLSIVRKPDHSTFNYIWQILQPPIVESVGISQKNQNLMKNIGGFFSKIGHLFTKSEKMGYEGDD